MERLRLGDEPALALLHDRHAGTLLGVALRVVGNRATAEEILQDVLWHVWRTGAYDARRGTPRAYLCLLTRSRATDRARSERAYRRCLTGLQWGVRPSGRTGWTSADELASREARACVRRAMLRLTERQRTAVRMAFFDGLSHAEIAGVLGQPLGTVKSHIRQGLSRLRDLVERHSDGAATGAGLGARVG